MGMLQKITKLFVGDDFQFGPKQKSAAPVRRLTDRDLLRLESKIGATLFGPVAKDRRREFFCLDESTWIWHEEWKDEKGVERQMTTRYEVHPRGILKVTEGPRYRFLEGQELANFVSATELYYQKVVRDIYQPGVNAKSIVAT